MSNLTTDAKVLGTLPEELLPRRVRSIDGAPLYVNEVLGAVGGMQDALDNLIAQIRAPKRREPVANFTQAQLDSNGDATFMVYPVASGLLFELTFVSAEIATFDATNPRTPASPYSHADFWLGLYVSGSNDAVAQGGLIDFTPTVDAAQGIPNIAQYNPPHLIRGGETLMCFVDAGPASQRLTIRYEGWLSQL